MTATGNAACLEHASEPSGTAVTVAVPLETFRKSIIDCDIYVRQGPDAALTLYRKKSHPLAENDLNRLAARGIRELYVSQGAHEAHRRQVTDEICRDTTVAPVDRYNLLREINRASFDAAYHSGEVEQVVTIVDEIGPQLTDVLCDSDLVVGELFALMDHDDCTYSHSVNVATYTILLAKYLGIHDQQRLCQVATGGLLHDLGKRHIQLEVLNKTGKLDRDDRKHIEQHPILGFRDLVTQDGLTWEQLMMVYQHHERYDGGGYPVGLVGREIADLARVTSVADVFHAVTSVRPYRQPMTTEEACRFLTDQGGKMFDPEIVRCWTSRMKTSDSA